MEPAGQAAAGIRFARLRIREWIQLPKYDGLWGLFQGLLASIYIIPWESLLG